MKNLFSYEPKNDFPPLHDVLMHPHTPTSVAVQNDGKQRKEFSDLIGSEKLELLMMPGVARPYISDNRLKISGSVAILQVKSRIMEIERVNGD